MCLEYNSDHALVNQFHKNTNDKVNISHSNHPNFEDNHSKVNVKHPNVKHDHSNYN